MDSKKSNLGSRSRKAFFDDKDLVSDGEGPHLVCPHCGVEYKDFKTGLCYQEVFAIFWIGNPDPRKWRYKRRNTVLGKWREIKLDMWKQHLKDCEQFDGKFDFVCERIEY